MIEPISRTTRTPALAYLERSPYLNVFLTHALLHDNSVAGQKNITVAVERGDIAGVAYWGRQLTLAAEPHAIAAFGEYAKAHSHARMIVGPRETIAAFWKDVRHWHIAPRLVRDRQLVMMVDRARLKPYERRVLVRQATIEEWSAVADGSAEMIRQELDYDPRRKSPEFISGIRQMIELGLWWVGIENGRLCFFCNIGPWSDRTLQLQGIWTPPSLRGRGLATASLAAICDRLLNVSPTLSLYVNDFNAAAIALYDRVGFEHVGDFQTLLF